MKQAGPDRPDRHAENFGDLVEGQVEIMVEDHHGAMFNGQSSETALELVAIDDRAQAFASAA